MRLFLLTVTLVAATMAFGLDIDSMDRGFYDYDFDGRLNDYELDFMLDDAKQAARQDNPC